MRRFHGERKKLRMQYNFNLDESCAFSAYKNPMTTEASREAEMRRLSSLKTKQDMIALENNMRQLAFETEEARNADLEADAAEKVAARLRSNAELRKKQVQCRLRLENEFKEKARSNSAQQQFTNGNFDDTLRSRKLEKQEFVNSIFNPTQLGNDNDFVSRSKLAEQEFRKNQAESCRMLEQEFHQKNLQRLNKQLESMDSQRTLARTNTGNSIEFARLMALNKLSAYQK